MSNSTLGDQPAFPFVVHGPENVAQVAEGMSTRTLIAAMALQGLLSSERRLGTPSEYAEEALKKCDALLAALEKPKCTCGEPHISDRIQHCYDGNPCFVKEKP